MQKKEHRGGIEVRFHKDGSLDEIILWNEDHKCSFHLEQMDDDHWWMGVYGDTESVNVHLTKVEGKIVASWDWDDLVPTT